MVRACVFFLYDICEYLKRIYFRNGVMVVILGLWVLRLLWLKEDAMFRCVSECVYTRLCLCVYLFDKVSDTSSRKEAAKRFFSFGSVRIWPLCLSVPIPSFLCGCKSDCLEALFIKTRSESHHGSIVKLIFFAIQEQPFI